MSRLSQVVQLPAVLTPENCETEPLWRPVEAERLSDDTLRLVAAQPKDGTTEHGSSRLVILLKCSLNELSGGRGLAAVELA
jgi:hypothetical protein